LGVREVKRPGRDVHKLPSSAEVKNEWSYTSTSLYAFVAWTETLILLGFYLVTLSVTQIIVGAD